MEKRKHKIRLPTYIVEFTSATDTPLRYFSTKRVFVRKSGCGNYKLYCDSWMVAMVSWDKFLYLYPALENEYLDYLEAFIYEYAPEVSFTKLKPHLGHCYFEYIGALELTTV